MSDADRRVVNPRSGEERIAALRLVLASREPAKIDGVFVEYHWARMILELHDEVGPEAKRELAETPVSRFPDLVETWVRRRRCDSVHP